MTCPWLPQLPMLAPQLAPQLGPELGPEHQFAASVASPRLQFLPTTPHLLHFQHLKTAQFNTTPKRLQCAKRHSSKAVADRPTYTPHMKFCFIFQ